MAGAAERAPEPPELAADVRWLSPAPEQPLLRTNAYLLRLAPSPDRSGESAVRVLVDPGSPAGWREIAPRVGDLGDLRLVCLTHMDSLALGCLPELAVRAPSAPFLMTWETWNLAALLGVPESRVRAAPRYRDGLRFPSVDRQLGVVLSPYHQFTGAFLLFEPRSGCLFTGDLLAGLDLDGDDPRFAREEDWTAIRIFQRRQMPCNAALRWLVPKIRAIPGLRRICPHHGGVIRGELIELFLDRLESLEVGADLLADREAKSRPGPEWDWLAAHILDAAGRERREHLLGALRRHPGAARWLELRDGRPVVHDPPQRAVELLIEAATTDLDPTAARRLRRDALLETHRLGLDPLLYEALTASPALETHPGSVEELFDAVPVSEPGAVAGR